MSTKRTVILRTLVVLLVVVIGVGIWVNFNNRQPRPQQGEQPSQQQKTFTLKEVAEHASKDDCWTIISGDVYDLTGYINRHPGGSEILRACGIDATTLFSSRQTEDGKNVGSGSPHSQYATEQLQKLKIGEVKEQ